MKKISKLLLSLSLILINLILCPLICSASVPECALTVVLEDKEKNAIDGLKINICKVADFNGTDYYPASGFESSGISVTGVVNDPSASNAENILEFVKLNNIDSVSAVSDSGKTYFDRLDTGIWLVYCAEDGTHSFNPYFVFLPYVSGDKISYQITSAPKTDINIPDNKSIYVVKIWDDNNDTAKVRPKSITAELKCNGAVIDSVILNEGNGWSYTFTDLPDEGKYEVAERSVKDYSVKYSGDSENGFIITNTYDGEKLPQTGQLWWPIAVICIVGVLFVLLGIIELGARKNETKNK